MTLPARMKISLCYGGSRSEVFLNHSKPTREPNVYLRISAESPDPSSVAGSNEVTISMTATEARQLAHRLNRAAVEDESAAAAEPGRRQDPKARPAPLEQRSWLFTKTQGRYLAFILRYQQRFLVSPAEADIAQHFLVSAPSVHDMIKMLERKRLIARTPGQARSIRLLVPPELLPVLE